MVVEMGLIEGSFLPSIAGDHRGLEFPLMPSPFVSPEPDRLVSSGKGIGTVVLVSKVALVGETNLSRCSLPIMGDWYELELANDSFSVLLVTVFMLDGECGRRIPMVFGWSLSIDDLGGVSL